MATFFKNSWTTFTVSVASPAIFTATAHNLVPGDIIILETTGALPTGLSVDTSGVQYIILANKMTNDAFTVASTAVNASGVIGNQGVLTPLNTSGTQSGTHTFLKLNNPRLVPAIQDNR